MDKTARYGIFFMTAALALTGAAVWAQGPDRAPQPEPGKKRTPQTEGARRQAADADLAARLTAQLQLREDQQKKVKAAIAKARPELDKLEAEMKALRERMGKAEFSAKESIRDILDLEQKMKFDRLGDRLLDRSQAGPCPGGPGPRGGPERMGPPMMEGGPRMEDRGPEGFPPRGRMSGPQGGDQPQGPPPNEAEDD
jgi:hypothetical protein